MSRYYELDVICEVFSDILHISERDIEEILDKVPTEDVVPRSELTDLEYKLTGVVHSVDKWLDGDELNQDEVNRAITMREKTLKIVENLEGEVEEIQKQLNDYKKFIGEIRVISENHAVIIDTEHTEYIDKKVADGLKNLAVKQAKQEVAREILGHLSSHTSIGIRHLKELMAECDNEENKIWLEGKISELCNLEKIISELRKKYIGG